MLYLWLFVLILFNTVWLALVAFGLPGNWLIVVSTGLFAWWQWDSGVFSIGTLVTVAVLALLAELAEFGAGMVGARKSGASWRGSIAALFGAMIGAVSGTFVIAVPLLGTVVGACLGAGLGVWGVEMSQGRHPDRSLRSGLSAGLGALVGILSKLAAGVVIWLIVVVAALWP
ncbi:MAG: DUF456 domain-containing protein [Phycisphaerales bacterium]|nr:MAG: DUF456 domain-containing protein [Phycisphaerales bacterium]